MEYNTQQRTLPLPEYGRSVQNMVDHALTIEDREERQRCANTIVNIMGGMFPHLRDVPDFKHKLWDHLAIMADFQLDIDYPFEIVKKEELNAKPEHIPYPQSNIRYRHYGHILEGLVKKAAEYPEGEERKQLLQQIANYMKKCFMSWNKDGVEDQKILDDLCEYSDGTIRLLQEEFPLEEPERNSAVRRVQPNNARRFQPTMNSRKK